MKSADIAAMIANPATPQKMPWTCTACGLVLRMRTAAEQKQSPRPAPQDLSFKMNACNGCCHIMAVEPDNTLRDLTKAEASELRRHPDWERVRAIVEAWIQKLHLIG